MNEYATTKAAYAGPKANGTFDGPAILAELGELETRIEEHTKIVFGLLDRLSPVVLPSGDGEMANPGTPRAPLSPIAERLDNACSNLRRLSDKVMELTNRLQV